MIEFNPKGNNILDQQLGYSGLEMNVAPLLPAAAGGGLGLGTITSALGIISGGISIFGGLFGSNKSDSQLAYQKEQQAINLAHAQEVAERTNEWSEKADKIDYRNYQNEREYTFKTVKQDWEHGLAIHEFDQLARMQQFRASRKFSRKQLKLNAKAQRSAIRQEQASIRDAFLKHQFDSIENGAALKETMFEASMDQQDAVLDLNKTLFDAAISSKRAKTNLDQSMFEGMISLKQQGVRLQGIKDQQAFGQMAIQENIDQLMKQNALQKETAMVEGLMAQGQAELAQAGKSRGKGLLSTTLALGRSLRALDGELSGRYKQAAIQMAELNADASLQETSIGLEGELTRGKMDFAQKEYAINLQNIGGIVDFARQEYSSTKQRLQGRLAFAQDEYAFNSIVLDANLKSSLKQAKHSIKDIMLDRKFADLEVEANRLSKPDKLPYRPMPELPPERIFLDRMEMVVPKGKTKSAGDKLSKILAEGGGPNPRDLTDGDEEKDKPYMDDKGNIKKGFIKTTREGMEYYHNFKTGERYRA